MQQFKKFWRHIQFTLDVLDVKNENRTKETRAKFINMMMLDMADESISYWKFAAHYEEQLEAFRRGEKTYPVPK